MKATAIQTKKMKRLIAILLLTILLFSSLKAQVSDSEDEYSPFFPDLVGQTFDEDPMGTENRLPGDIPVDGGLSLLLAAGAAYGVRKVRRRKVIK